MRIFALNFLIIFLFTALGQAVSLKELTASCIKETRLIQDFGHCDKKDADTCACKESRQLLAKACERSTSAAAESCGSRINVNPCVSNSFTNNFNSEVKSVKTKVDEYCASEKTAAQTNQVVEEITYSTPSIYREGLASDRALTNCKTAFKRTKIMKSCETKMFNDCVCQNYEAEQTQACETSVALQVEACREFRNKDDLLATCLLQNKTIQESEAKKADNRMEKACNISLGKASQTQN